ncbi:hypothetical protein phiSA1p28 [Streptomyces phage phiSASD1]|uniref:Gp5 n=1 Tax=Streptomyces phage phiSASD1 TaxID=747763 RepID=D7NW74_9CAUD|nr:hypothetical protein phiSA1p28 [Streptomyces phage phiSASD1]ADE43472.1 gp5 [Streptomyces phage phiSASD1]
MRVYRVAHTSRTSEFSGTAFPVGPYNSEDYQAGTTKRMVIAHGGAEQRYQHPTPTADPYLNGLSSWEVCGLSSMDALLDWFAQWLRTLDDAGFVIWTYDVPDADVRVGRTGGQVVFTASEAVLISKERIPLEDQQLALFAPGDVLPGPVVRDSETPGQPLGTSSPDQ